MKALIRNNGETVTEANGIAGIEWTTGAPLTNDSWSGGPYTLVQNYVPPEGDEKVVIEFEQTVVEENEDDYVIIDGKRYSKEELRALL